MAASAGAVPEQWPSVDDGVSEMLMGNAEARAATVATTSASKRRAFVSTAPAFVLIVGSVLVFPLCARHDSAHLASAATAAARHHAEAEAIDLGAESTEFAGGWDRLEDFIGQVTARAELLEPQHFAVISQAASARGLQGEGTDSQDVYDDIAEKLNNNITDNTYASPLNESKLLQATCVIDVLYIVSCLGYAINSLYQASASRHSRCPDSSAQGCAVEVTNAISCLSWVAYAISASVSDCPQVLDQKAVCAADIIGMIADVTGIASAATDVGSSCGAVGASDLARESALQNLTAILESGEGRRLKFGKHGLLRRAITEASNSAAPTRSEIKIETGWSIGVCVFDVIMASALLMQMGTTIARATEDCPNPRACAVDMLSILGCASWAATSFAAAASDCDPPLGSVGAECASDVTNIFAQLNFLAAYATSVGHDCNFSVVNESRGDIFVPGPA
ncbi:unnamed protein product [Prorocentrum cordatum]|uniref:Uncharacterized protein n=1 Tax=Prorocentrum cordatum TaxID=2364126 RepID=A0ABN9Y2G2_9DINO|nr:unnamed protein product [Polarella glacialis]